MRLRAVARHLSSKYEFNESLGGTPGLFCNSRYVLTISYNPRHVFGHYDKAGAVFSPQKDYGMDEREDEMMLTNRAIVLGAAFQGLGKIALISFLFATAACATTQDSDVSEFGAYGYLSPNLDATPELIGVYDSEAACREAAKDWMSRQVVGNPVRGECYPADRN